MNTIKASIIIPTYNKLSRLRMVLKAFEKQMVPEVEIVVVFDGCNQETLDGFKQLNFQFNLRTVICEQNVGRSVARNKGIEAAKGEIIIFVDDDRIPGDGFVQAHLKGHTKNCVFLGGRKEINVEESEIERLFYDLEGLELYFKTAQNEFRRKIQIKPYHFYRWAKLYTGNVSIKKAELLKIGGFDEQFVVWGNEDLDLGIRLQKVGLPFVQDLDVLNYHLVHESNLVDKRKESRINLMYMIRKYRKDLGVTARLVAMLLLQALVGMPVAKFAQSKKSLKKV